MSESEKLEVKISGSSKHKQRIELLRLIFSMIMFPAMGYLQAVEQIEIPWFIWAGFLWLSIGDIDKMLSLVNGLSALAEAAKKIK